MMRLRRLREVLRREALAEVCRRRGVVVDSDPTPPHGVERKAVSS